MQEVKNPSIKPIIDGFMDSPASREVAYNAAERIMELAGHNIGHVLEAMRIELRAQIRETNTQLNTKIQETNTQLNAKIQETSAQLNAKIQETRTQLDARIRETNTQLSAQARVADSRHEALNTKFTMLLWMFGALVAISGLLVASGIIVKQ